MEENNYIQQDMEEDEDPDMDDHEVSNPAKHKKERKYFALFQKDFDDLFREIQSNLGEI